MCLVPILDGVAQAGGCSGVVQPADNVAPMVLPPFIVKGGFLLASILFRVLDEPHGRWLAKPATAGYVAVPPFSNP